MEAQIPTVIEACADPTLLNVKLSPAQSALLKATYALPMSEPELEIFREATGQSDPPSAPFKTASVLAGRRSGKSSRYAAVCAAFEACIAKHEIPETERGVVLVLAPIERQARTTFRVIERLISRSPKLRDLVEAVRTGGNENEIQLSTGIDIRVAASNSRTVRGELIVAAILEEQNFFKDSDSGQYNAEEILAALRPALLTLPDSKLISISSPWVASGPMFDDFQKRPEGTLTWALPSWKMNPGLNSLLLWAEKKRDPQRFEIEYGCKWLQAASALVPSVLIDKAVVVGQSEFPAQSGVRGILALDPSSKGSDSFAYAIAHRENGKIKLDLAREFKSPGDGRFIDYNFAVPEIIATAKQYRVTDTYSDQVNAAALAAMFAEKGFSFHQVSTYGTKASGIYQAIRRMFTSGEIILPDNPTLINQLRKLEEVLMEGGKSVVEAKTGHDDAAVAACLAIYEASLLPESREPSCGGVFWHPSDIGDPDDRFYRSKERVPSWSRARY